MRDIKFRIWDGVKNEWLASSNKDALPYYGFALVGEVMTVQSPPIWSLDEGNIVEQFTGLKDINGTEIYEGDIVKHYHHHRGVPYRVYWADKSAKFLIGRDGVIGQSFSDIMHNLNTGRIALEVVGNIHENSELLEEKG